MRIPKKVICEFQDANDSPLCEVDNDGWGRCGDSIMWGNDVCLWVKEVLEWQEEGNES